MVQHARPPSLPSPFLLLVPRPTDHVLNEDNEEREEAEGDELGEKDAEDDSEKPSKKQKHASSPAPKAKKAPAKAAPASKAKAGEGEEDVEGGGRGRASKKSKTGGEDVNAKLESDPEALKVRKRRHKLQKSSNKALPERGGNAHRRHALHHRRVL
ncbi:hypothetical protein B0H14DRAFT_865937 [Mycena olivaceomarginata]|nr:hypothetical protein B0H14DRAFT_865937 [Mycena olivaceomarginata]